MHALLCGAVPQLGKASTGNKMPVFAPASAWCLPGALGAAPCRAELTPVGLTRAGTAACPTGISGAFPAVAVMPWEG